MFACSVIVSLDLLFFFFSFTVSPPPLPLWSLNFHKPLLLYVGRQEPFWSLASTIARIYVMLTLPFLPLRQKVAYWFDMNKIKSSTSLCVHVMRVWRWDRDLCHRLVYFVYNQALLAMTKKPFDYSRTHNTCELYSHCPSLLSILIITNKSKKKCFIFHFHKQNHHLT